jgi:arylsulfatase A-like enzyme
MNIIFINSDTFRYDNLFDRAEMPVRTPDLDAFADRAVSFSRFYAASFPTIPERTDFASGRYGWPFYGWQDLAKSTRNRLTHMLHKGGFVSQLICDCPHLFNTGFQRMFTAATAVRGQEGDLAFLRMNHPIEQAMPPEKTRTGHHFQDHNLVDLHRWHNANWRLEEDTFPPRTARLAVEWLEENYRYDPFFLWVDFFDPHEPWDPPEYMVRRYDPDYDGTPMLHPNYGKASDLTPAELRNLKAHYAAESELVDRWVGRVLQKIDDLALWDNSIVIFTTDHGHSIGEHNRTGKSNINDNDDRFWPLYPEVAQIPFMIAAPGLEGGRELDIFCQPVDTLPTLLDMAGIEADAPEPIHGKSFAPHLRGEDAPPLREFAICGSKLNGKDGRVAPQSVTPVLYTPEWAYAPIGPEGERELFALADDPYAEDNVAAAHPDVVKELHALLLGWLRDIGAAQETIALLGPA